MIYLFTGAIGTGKTTYVVDQIMQEHAKNEKLVKDGQLDKVRKIYSNVSGLKVPHEPLPDDWRETPKNSILVIDECHKIEIYQPTRKALHSDPRIVAMNESRHDGYDFYFITQQPAFIHKHIKGLVNKHYHFHNPMGANVANVFVWRHGNTTTPDSATAKNSAEENFLYTFKKSIQSNFDSMEQGAQDTKKFKIPKKVLFWALLPFFLIGFMIYLLTKPNTVGNLTGSTYTNEASKQAKNLQQAKENMQNVAQNVTPQHVLPDSISSPQQQVQQTQQVQYDVTKPYDQPVKVQYDVVEKPRIAGCIASSRVCNCYTQQGTKIHMSIKDCRRFASGDRPFDYFHTPRQNFSGDVAGIQPSTAFNSALGSKDSTATGAVAPDLQKAKVMYENKEGI